MQNVMELLSNLIIPLFLFFILLSGIRAKRNCYEDFLEGAKDGLKTVWKIMPTLVGLLVAVGILRASGFLNLIADIIGMATEKISMPSQLVPLILVKIFSSSAATGLLLDIYEQYGADSYTGLAASIIMSCTETILYTISIYFAVVKVTKTRWTMAGALIATLAGVIASVVLGGML